MSGVKVAVITGGTDGIGLASAALFVQRGWKVVVGGRSQDKGRRAEESLGAEAASFVQGDVADPDVSRRLVAAAAERWGRLDAFVANAAARVYSDFESATPADWDTVLSVNIKAPAYGARFAVPALKAAGGGAIVIVSSLNARVARRTMPLYDLTKAAQISIAKSLAIAYGRDGIRANAVCPGWIITEFHARNAGVTADELRRRNPGHNPLGFPGVPSDIASVLFFLCSEEGRHVTGQEIYVDGGESATSMNTRIG
jgi:NAD(P)-dependent dehydrogenase (short-subunit alcohol dehydrogenase family)